MSYVALYRKWRPVVFEDIIGQEHVTGTLKNSVMQGRVSHAYLFSGTRGTGKTTAARIFSRAINCPNQTGGNPCNKCEICTDILNGSSLDVIEIDAASNNGVDNIRDIRDEVVYAPSAAKYKVYIIDEVHMLSTGAFNALLKTLEEPPPHAVFFLATTEPQKLPATILSRCQKYEFKRIPRDMMTTRLGYIAENTGFKLEADAAELIARISDGAMRDAVSILDQCLTNSEGTVTYAGVMKVTGMLEGEYLADMADSMADGDVVALLSKLDSLIMSGKEVNRITGDLILYFRDMLLENMDAANAALSGAMGESAKRLEEQAKRFGKKNIIAVLNKLSELEASIKWSASQRVLLEIGLIRLCGLMDPAQQAGNGGASEASQDAAPPIKAAHRAPPVKESKPERAPDQAQTPVAAPAQAPAPVTKPEPVQEQALAETPEEKKEADSAEAHETYTPPPSSLSKEWERVMADIEKNDKSLAVFLRDTRANLNGTTLTVIFRNERSFFMEMVSSGNNYDTVLKKVRAEVGPDAELRFTLDKDFVKPKNAAAEAGRAPDPDELDGSLKKIKEISDAKGIPFTIIE